MKVLYLVRHAKSSWKDSSLSDFDRPLNGRGKRDAPEMGQRFLEKGIVPDDILSSPANRALSTCHIIANAINFPEKTIKTNKRIYHADETELLSLLQEVDDSCESLMLFGHNPAFTWFANGLNRTDIDNIPTCGVVACELQIDHWSEIKMGVGKQLFFDYPKN